MKELLLSNKKKVNWANQLLAQQNDAWIQAPRSLPRPCSCATDPWHRTWQALRSAGPRSRPSAWVTREHGQHPCPPGPCTLGRTPRPLSGPALIGTPGFGIMWNKKTKFLANSSKHQIMSQAYMHPSIMHLIPTLGIKDILDVLTYGATTPWCM